MNDCVGVSGENLEQGCDGGEKALKREYFSPERMKANKKIRNN